MHPCLLSATLSDGHRFSSHTDDGKENANAIGPLNTCYIAIARERYVVVLRKVLLLLMINLSVQVW